MAQFNYTAANSSSTGYCSEDSTWKTTLKVFAHVINMFISLFGNVALCIVVKRNGKLRKTMDYLIVNNAVSDLVIPLLASPRAITELIVQTQKWQVSGHLGELCCKLVNFVSDLCPMVSMITLVYLTVSRFSAVVFPFHAARAPTELRIYYIASSWIISVVFSSPYLVYIKLGPDGSCTLSWAQSTHTIYSTVIVVFFLIIPLALIITMYATILYFIRRRSKKLPRHDQIVKKRNERMTRNMTILCFCIVLSFVLCWGPFFALAVAVIYFRKIIKVAKTMCYLNDFYFAARLLAYSNASINPSLCLIFIENYRDGLRRVLGLKTKGTLPSFTALERQKTLGLRRSTCVENVCYVSAV